MESQNALIYLQAAYVCECSLSVSSSLRVTSDAETLVPKAYPPASLLESSLGKLPLNGETVG